MQTRHMDLTDGPSMPSASPAEISRDAIAFALGFCASRLGTGIDVVASLRHDEPDAHEYFRHGLALRLARRLAGIDGTIGAIYVHGCGEPIDEVESPRAGTTTPLTLCLRVDRATAGLRPLLRELDAALTEQYRELLSPRADRLRSLLDVKVVEERDVLERVGHGALIVATRERPNLVWQRQGGQ